MEHSSAALGVFMNLIGNHEPGLYRLVRSLCGIFLNVSREDLEKGFMETYVFYVSITEGTEEIPHDAFYGCIDLVHVSFPATITRIGEGAFSNCHSLISMVFPSNLTSIGNSAFEECAHLGSVKFTGPGPVQLPDYCFAHCSNLATVIFPSSLETIERATFMRCGSLGPIALPGSVECIWRNAFSGCLRLEVTLPEGIRLGNYAFDDCDPSKVELPSAITFLGNDIFGIETPFQ